MADLLLGPVGRTGSPRGHVTRGSASSTCHRGSATPPATALGPQPNRHHRSAADLWHSRGEHHDATSSTTSATPIKRDDVPAFRAGDTIKVHVKVVEGNRSRVQVFQGVVIRVQGSGVGRTFTVRKVSFGVGVERTFPLHSPIFEKIEIVTRGDVRRAKLYYLRNLRGKAAKIKERREA